jgi:hypothetical protein
MAFCKNCGTEVPQGTEYCPTCGSRVTGEGSGDSRRSWRGPMGTGRWSEWGEDWGHWWSWTLSPLWMMVNAVVFGLGIILIGTLLFLATSGYMSLVSWDTFWALLLIGLGALGVIRETAKYYLSGRRLWRGGMFLALILIILGAAGLIAHYTDWAQYWWAFVIVAGGLLVIVWGVLNYVWMRGRYKK